MPHVSKKKENLQLKSDFNRFCVETGQHRDGPAVRRSASKNSVSRSTTHQIFTLKQIFEKSWEYSKDLFSCFVDLEKAYDRVQDKLWRVLQEYGIDGQLLLVISLPLSLSTVNRKSVFVSTVSSQSHSMWALVSGKGVCCLLSFS